MINEYIAVDVETTGLSPERDRLLEIGAVHVQDGKVIKTFWDSDRYGYAGASADSGADRYYG